MMNAEGTSKKYDNVFEFFKRTALKATEHTQLSKAAKVFGASFGGTAFEQNGRNYQNPLASTNAHSDDIPTPIVSKAATVTPPIPYRKWTPRVAAMSARTLPMATVPEDDEEAIDDEELNENKNPINNIISDVQEHPPATSIKIMTASEKLSSACFGMVIRNSCKQVNCEYSHDKAIIAVARDKQIADLTAAKRAMQDGHQA